MSQETVKILKMLEEGKISTREADSLLSALGERSPRHGGNEFHAERERFRDDIETLKKEIHQINPGRIVAEAMAGVKEGLKEIKGIHLELDDLRGSHKAEDTKEISIPAAGITAISASQPRSDFEITGTDGDRIIIRADIQAWAEDKEEAEEKLRSLDISTENDSGTLRIKLDGPPWTKKRRAKVDFTIQVPRGIMAEISSAGGDITACGLDHGAKLNTASGDISVSACQGEQLLSSASGDIGASGCREASLQLNTASGDIVINDCSGDLAFQTVSGDVSLVLAGDIQGQTVSGDIDINAGKPAAIKVRSTSGDVQFRGPLGEGSVTAIATVSGDVSLKLGDGPSGIIEAGTVSGDIECGLELSDHRKSSRALSGKLGSGLGSLTVKTVSGDIEIN